MQSKHKQSVNIAVADETLTDYSFLSKYHYTKSNKYFKRRYRIRHLIPMFIYGQWTCPVVDESQKFRNQADLTVSCSYPIKMCPFICFSTFLFQPIGDLNANIAALVISNLLNHFQLYLSYLFDQQRNPALPENIYFHHTNQSIRFRFLKPGSARAQSNFKAISVKGFGSYDRR